MLARFRKAWRGRKLDEAFALAREAVAGAPPADRLKIAALIRLGAGGEARLSPEQAEQALALAIDLVTSVHGPGSGEEVGLRLARAGHLSERRPDAAAAELDRAVALAEALPSEVDLLVDALGRRAALRADRGDLAGAEQDYRRAIELETRRGGATSIDLGPPLRGLEGLLERQGRWAEAIPVRKQILRTCLGKGSGADDVAELAQLGRLLARAGQHTEALRTFEQVLRRTEKGMGKDHLWTAWALRDVAETAATLGDSARARQLLSRAVSILERLGHSDAARLRPRLAALSSDEEPSR